VVRPSYCSRSNTAWIDEGREGAEVGSTRMEDELAMPYFVSCGPLFLDCRLSRCLSFRNWSSNQLPIVSVIDDTRWAFLATYQSFYVSFCLFGRTVFAHF